MMMSIMLVDIVGRDVMFAQPMSDHNVVANRDQGFATWIQSVDDFVEIFAKKSCGRACEKTPKVNA